MKTAILSFLLMTVASLAHAQDRGYQTSLAQLNERLQTLEVERADYRKAAPGSLHPKLSPAQAVERYSLLGQLFSEDPIWALSQQLQANIEALADPLKPGIPEENRAVLEADKDFLALSVSFDGRAITHAQAVAFAVTLRQFIARRDVSGARIWASSHRPQ